MIVKLLTEHHLEFLSFKRGCRGSSESTHVKMPHCWKSHALAQFLFRMDTQNKTVGVFSLYFRNSIKYKRRHEYEISKIETIWTEIELPNTKSEYDQEIQQ